MDGGSLDAPPIRRKRYSLNIYNGLARCCKAASEAFGQPASFAESARLAVVSFHAGTRRVE